MSWTGDFSDEPNKCKFGCLVLEVLRENLYLGDVGLVLISLRRPEFWAMTLACYFLVFPLFALTIFTDFVWLVRFI
jgi:hypothetical protein